MMIRAWLVFLVSAGLTLAHAAPLSPEQVPEALQPWIGWVLQDVQERDCPFLYNSYEHKRCAWPTQLALSLYEKQGRFTISWQVYRESWVSVPGSVGHWPQNVTVNQKPAQVLEKNKQPGIKLGPGHYQISGDFSWDSLPENLTVPADTGLISLKINDKNIPSPRFKQDRLWLKTGDNGGKTAENNQNSLTLQVFRKIIDDVPLQVETLLQLEVSGVQRELKLAQPLLEGFLPLRIASPLPARLEPDGQLLVQVRPGRWQIQIDARSVKQLSSIPLAKTSRDWTDHEIWVFAAQPALRVVEIENLAVLDPSQTNLPASWKSLPAYSIRPGESLGFKVISRGAPQMQANQLNLHRTLWLDFNGGGYTVNDTITGLLTQGWRLEVTPPMQLGKASLDGANQLVTRLAGSSRQGVEVRTGVINLAADSRIAGAIDTISAVGWHQNFHRVEAELNLPPGWRLLAATGVDNVPDSWLARWTLLDLFVVLIAALAVGRLWNIYWGVMALMTLALSWHEPGAPQFVWLNILAATALLRVLPTGAFKIFVVWYRNAAWLGLIVIAIPFMVAQVRIGLYPQLEKPWQALQTPAYKQPASSPSTMTAESKMMMPQQALSKARRAGDEVAQTARAYPDEAVNFKRVDPNAHIQTGPGLPQWRWHKIQLSWNGSVDADQPLRLWYLPPTVTLLLNFLRVLLIAGLALLLFGPRGNWLKGKTILTGLSGFLLIPMLLWPGHEALADFPDQALLDELKTRLLEAPDCLPGCAEIPRMRMSLTDESIDIELQIHNQETVAVPLPADYEQWFPQQVSIDGVSAPALYSANNGLWLNLEPGLHQVTMHGTPPRSSKFVLPLPLKPMQVTIDSNGWEVSGVHENGSTDQQLQFRKTATAATQSAQKRLEPGVLPPFVRIERTLQLGLDWRIVTRVVRVSPPGSAIVLDFPLLPDESVISAGVRVEDKKVKISMTPGQTVMHWQSLLEKTEVIKFMASDTEQWTEVWQADIAPLWHVETEGLTMLHQNRQGAWLPQWRPWPGESVTFNITRPEPVAGQTLTIENSRLTLVPGQRSRQTELAITLNSSQGGQHTLTLPEQARLESVEIDGVSQPVRQQGRSVTLPIHPGTQQFQLNWQEAVALAGIIKTPRVDLGRDSVNTSLSIKLGQDRWLLWTAGPSFGPAVLLWGIVIVIVMLAWALGKAPVTPLKSRHWLLLLIGLSQIPVASAFVVVAWLMLLGVRAAKPPERRGYFNALQVLLGVLTLISLMLLFWAVQQGLLGSPQMQISGNQSQAYQLNWYQDRSAALLPEALAVSVPLMVYRLLMLAWSLWLAISLLNWLKWGWTSFSTQGLWKNKPLIEKTSGLTDRDQ